MHDLKGEEKYLLVGGVDAHGRKIVQSGLVDRDILCAKHDGILGVYDKYGIEFCRTFNSHITHPAPNIWRISEVNSEKLVKFWLSILWRFSISCLPEAKDVKLGPYEYKIQDILFATASCSVEPEITMLRYRSTVIPPENICAAPYKTLYPGLDEKLRRNAYGIALAGFQAFIKVDAQPLPFPLHQITINGKGEINGGYLNFEGTHQFRRMHKVAKNMGLKPQAINLKK